MIMCVQRNTLHPLSCCYAIDILRVYNLLNKPFISLGETTWYRPIQIPDLGQKHH